jgi:hypothetical protein
MCTSDKYLRKLIPHTVVETDDVASALFTQYVRTIGNKSMYHLFLSIYGMVCRYISSMFSL